MQVKVLIHEHPMYGVIKAEQCGPLVKLFYDDGSIVAMSSGGLILSDATIARFAINAKRPIDLEKKQEDRINANNYSSSNFRINSVRVKA